MAKSERERIRAEVERELRQWSEDGPREVGFMDALRWVLKKLEAAGD